MIYCKDGEIMKKIRILFLIGFVVIFASCSYKTDTSDKDNPMHVEEKTSEDASINTKPESYTDIKFEGGTEWKMLFLVFRNNNINYTDSNGNLIQDNNVMSNEEIQCIKDLSLHFTNDVYLDSNKQIYPIVDVYVVDTPICKLTESGNGPWLSSEGTHEIIKDMININDYDHITVFANLNNIKTSYFGLGGTYFEQYTGYTFINTINKEQWLAYCDTNTSWTPSVVVHEFLHFIESWSKHLDKEISIGVHDAETYGYNDSDDWRGWYKDFMTGNVKDASGNSAGVSSKIWNSPPGSFR